MNKRIAKKKFKNRIIKLAKADKKDLLILSIDNYSDFIHSNNSHYIKEICKQTGINIICIPHNFNPEIIKSDSNDLTSVPYMLYTILNDSLTYYHKKEYDKIEEIFRQLYSGHTINGDNNR